MGGRSVVLSVRGLTVSYFTAEGRIRALSNVSLEVCEGEALCLVGESGSGKSTLAYAIAGALPSNALIEGGSVLLDGIDVLGVRGPRDEAKLRKSVAIVFQDPASSFNPLFTMGQHFVDVLGGVLGLPRGEALRVSREVLRRVRLHEPERVLASYPWELSGGMLQRAAIALALAKRPRVLVADEPTTNLDVTTQAEILELLREVNEEYGLTLIMVTHNFGVAAETCERVAVMYAGTLVETGPIDEVLKSPLHPYTRLLIRAVPRVGGRVPSPIPGAPPDLRSLPPGCPFYGRCDSATPLCAQTPPAQVAVEGSRVVSCHLYSSHEGGGA